MNEFYVYSGDKLIHAFRSEVSALIFIKRNKDTYPDLRIVEQEDIHKQDQKSADKLAKALGFID